MSKSKKNTVDPDDIIAAYGADTARWFMLSDIPPERDVIWTEEGVQGAWRFVQRLWRLIGEIAQIDGARPPRPAEFGEEALTVRKAAHRALANVSDDIDKLRFNRCVAHIYEFANALSDAIGEVETAPSPGPGLGAARSRRHPGAAVPPDDAASGRGVLGGAGPQDAGRHRGLAGSSRPICWSRTPSPCRSRSTARSAPTSPWPGMLEKPRLRLPFWPSMR